jgi:hypothetical protein
LSSGFETCDVLREMFVSPSPNAKLEGPGQRIHGTGEKVTQVHH